MTLRDYFAAKAMEGVIAGAMADGSRLGKESPREFALTAYIIADAMLVAREKSANPLPMPKPGTLDNRPSPKQAVGQRKDNGHVSDS